MVDKAPSGCYVSGLYLEGAKWDLQKGCLTKSSPKVLTEELPVLRIIPIEANRLKLVVSLMLARAYRPVKWGDLEASLGMDIEMLE